MAHKTIHLTPKDSKSIILIGGMNGVGKTTLLDAVRLCLYGKRALGNRVSLSEYHDYLSEIIHRSPTGNSSINSASVSLEFEYARDGEKKRHTVNAHGNAKGVEKLLKMPLLPMKMIG